MADAETTSNEGSDERGVRTQRMLADPDFMDKFCAHIANGGAGPEYCQERDVRFSDVMGWINRDEDRRLMYGRAETARSAWFVQSILSELKNIGLVDIRQAYNSSGGLKNVQDIPEAVARCIVAIESEELFEGNGKNREQVGWTKRVKFSDKLRALELLGKNLQMFIDTSRVVLQGRVTLEDLVSATANPAAIDVTPVDPKKEVAFEQRKENPQISQEASVPGSGTIHADGPRGVDIGPI